MLAGRYLTLLPMLAVAGSLASKKTVADGTGTFPTATPLFMLLLVFVVLVVGGLTFLPALRSGHWSNSCNCLADSFIPERSGNMK